VAALSAIRPSSKSQIEEGARFTAGGVPGRPDERKATLDRDVKAVGGFDPLHLPHMFPYQRGRRFRSTNEHRELAGVLARLRPPGGGLALGASGDRARLVTRLLGRERELRDDRQSVRAQQARDVRQHATRPADADHERYFEPDGDGFVYRLVVEYEPRGGIAGLFDRLLLARGIRSAFERTFMALERELASPESSR
jgi:hypothetical protein